MNKGAAQDLGMYMTKIGHHGNIWAVGGRRWTERYRTAVAWLKRTAYNLVWLTCYVICFLYMQMTMEMWDSKTVYKFRLEKKIHLIYFGVVWGGGKIRHSNLYWSRGFFIPNDLRHWALSQVFLSKAKSTIRFPCFRNLLMQTLNILS